MSLPGWNYRVCKERFHYKIGKRKRVETVFTLREVHYDKDGNAKSWSAEPMTIVGDNREEMIIQIGKALEGACKPVLWIGNTRSERK